MLFSSEMALVKMKMLGEWERDMGSGERGEGVATSLHPPSPPHVEC